MPKLSSSWIQISTHALREEGDTEGTDFCSFLSISTHALREEGDGIVESSAQSMTISTHALREEGDRTSWSSTSRPRAFLPTPSARRATHRTRVI